MNDDLTILYYTANRIAPAFATAVAQELVDVVSDYCPIVIVSQNQEAAGCPDSIACLVQNFPKVTLFDVQAPPSIYQVYKNILLAAKAAETPFVACCEDDTIYHLSHFTYRPAPDTFAYDRSRWVITRKLSDDQRRREAFYYWRERHQMAMCIAPRLLLIETLEEKFTKYPVPPPSTDVAKKAGWGEPGRYEKNLSLTRRKIEYFDSPGPSVTFNHGESLMGRRRVNPDDKIATSLEPWGEADELWKVIHG